MEYLRANEKLYGFYQEIMDSCPESILEVVENNGKVVSYKGNNHMGKDGGKIEIQK
ncbi:MAG: hypothetical protein BroJett041_01240 [Candidatus Jettenia caeni]|nr:MAG: hypothetical protein BroJett041_01240 [Candidatus Jettenia caeni]